MVTSVTPTRPFGFNAIHTNNKPVNSFTGSAVAQKTLGFLQGFRNPVTENLLTMGAETSSLPPGLKPFLQGLNFMYALSTDVTPKAAKQLNVWA